MTAKLTIINVALFFLFLFISISTYDVWNQAGPGYRLPAADVPKTAYSPKQEKVDKHQSEASFNIIAKRNLFSKDRAEFIPVVESKEPEIEIENKIKGKTIVLYGVVLMKNHTSALVTNPDRKPGDKPTIWVKEGDRFGKLKVASIKNDNVILEEGHRKYKILLHDKQKNKVRSGVRKSDKPTVVSAAVPKKKPKKNSRKNIAPSPGSSPGEYETISTPFGTMKRRKK